jgi:outer membrane protein OmpA-like peptidoglycan-associated protein
VFPELDDHIVDDDQPAQSGRVRYQPGGVDAPIGAATIVEVRPRIRRGRLLGMLFEVDKSFLLPGAMVGIRGLTRYYGEHPGLHVLVSGHTDPTGADQYNLDLSNERAQSIADFLRDEVDGWMAWYSSGLQSKRWGIREDQYMLSALRDPVQAFYAGPIDGVNGATLQDAVRRFQASRNAQQGSDLAVDGQLGPKTRRELVTMYMTQDETTLPPGTPLEIHGCGEFHPAEPGSDPQANAEDRRVEIFLFEGPVDPPVPPRCPAPGCREYPIWRARVFEDVDFRTAPPPADPVPSNPRFEVATAPDLEELAITLFSTRRQPCPATMATVIVDRTLRFVRSDGAGVVRALVPKGTARVAVRYVPPELVTPIEIAIDLELPPVSDDAGAIGRLVHLGYPAASDLQFAVFRFQSDFGVTERTGQLDDATRKRLTAVYDDGAHP